MKNQIAEIETSVNQKALSKIAKEIDRRRVIDFLSLMNSVASIGKGIDETILETFENLKKSVTPSQYNSSYYAVKKYFLNSTDSMKRKSELREYFEQDSIKPFVVGYNIKELPDSDSVHNAIEKANPEIAYIIQFLANTGLRISELIDIKLSDISMNGKAHIRVKRLKKKLNLITTIDLPRDFLEEIILHFHKDHFSEIENKNINLFVTRGNKAYNRVNLSNQIKAKLGFSAHKLRHFFAHENYEKYGIAGINKLLAQSSMDVTNKYLQNVLNKVNYSDGFKMY